MINFHNFGPNYTNLVFPQSAELNFVIDLLQIRRGLVRVSKMVAYDWADGRARTIPSDSIGQKSEHSNMEEFYLPHFSVLFP